MAESLRTEIDNLKTKTRELENDILATVEKLTNSQKELETSLKKQEVTYAIRAPFNGGCIHFRTTYC